MSTRHTRRLVCGVGSAFAVLLVACASAPRAANTTARRFEGCVHYSRWQVGPTLDLYRVSLGDHTLVPAPALDTLDLQNFAGRRAILTADVRAGTDTIEVTHIDAVPGRSCPAAL